MRHMALNYLNPCPKLHAASLRVHTSMLPGIMRICHLCP